MNPIVHQYEHDSTGETSVSRRGVIIGLGAAAASASLLGHGAFGQERGARFDLHHHYYPAWTREGAAPGSTAREYSPAKAIEEMDRAGVRTAILSGLIPAGVRDESNRRVRETNEFGASLVSDHSGRFGLFASVPLPDIDASLREIEYAFDTLRADGIFLFTSYGNRWTGNTAFEPVLDELDRRNAVVYSHPTTNACCADLLANTLPTTVEWNTDTSRAIWSLINDGEDRPPVTTPVTSKATQYANIQFVWSHAGGTLLGLIGRFLGRSSLTQKADLSPTPARNSKLYHLRRFYYDTAGSANPIQMQALKALVGSSQIVLGSDYPFVPIIETVEALQECGFSAEELEGIDRANALRILPAWNAR